MMATHIIVTSGGETFIDKPIWQLLGYDEDPGIEFVVSVGVAREHVASKDCWCNPVVVDDFRD